MAKDKAEKKEKAPKAELTPEEAAAAGKKKKMLIFIIGGVLGTTAIGGGLALFLAGGKDPKAGEEASESAKGEGKEEKHGEKKEGAKGEGKEEKHGEKKEGAKGEGKEEKHGEKKEGGKEEKHGEKKEGGKDEKKEGGKEEKSKKDDKKDAKDSKIDGVDFGCTLPLQAFHLNLGNPLENRYIRLEIAIEYSCGEETKAEIDKRLPQLRDAVIHVTSRKTREFLLGPDGKEQLRKEIYNQINTYMNKKIDDVFITDILIE
ncbi:MAG: flagellar basal body-associated FliL family protein [Proteobacteria bacterium]|nr:flagellar basal body-associated FliL family protein [Pseudomonadota bacterium]